MILLLTVLLTAALMGGLLIVCIGIGSLAFILTFGDVIIFALIVWALIKTMNKRKHNKRIRRRKNKIDIEYYE